MGVSQYSELPFINISEAGMRKLLEAIKPHQATGPDWIPARLSKDYATILAPVLTHIYQASLSQRRVPADWKYARVITVYKKGAKTSPSNYLELYYIYHCLAKYSELCWPWVHQVFWVSANQKQR